MSAFELSKNYIDVGLFTNAGDSMQQFYGEQLGLKLIDSLILEDGYCLHRYNANGSALKLNVLDVPLRTMGTNYVRVLLPDKGRSRISALRDPDGVEVELVPPGYLDIHQLGIVYKVPSLAVADTFARGALGAKKLGEGRYQFGETVLLFETAPTLARSGALEAKGFTYTTLHVRDVVRAHAHLVANGCEEAIPPTPFKEITTYSFVRDPMGNWIEISQRADLVGKAAVVSGPILTLAQVQEIRRRP
jgi:lactoylglutathione lyase